MIKVEFKGKVGEFCYQTLNSVGADLVAQAPEKDDPVFGEYYEKTCRHWVKDSYIIAPGCSALIHTGVFITESEQNGSILYSLDVRPRSGMSCKDIDATLGTIDSDYPKEILVNLFNKSNSIFTVVPGDRIAQLVGQVNFRINGIPVKNQERKSGFGSTGV